MRSIHMRSGQAARLPQPLRRRWALPLEAQQLGMEVHASDLNPVATRRVDEDQ